MVGNAADVMSGTTGNKKMLDYRQKRMYKGWHKTEFCIALCTPYFALNLISELWKSPIEL